MTCNDCYWKTIVGLIDVIHRSLHAMMPNAGGYISNDWKLCPNAPCHGFSGADPETDRCGHELVKK